MKKSILTLLVLFVCVIQTTTAYEYFTIYFSDGTKSEAFYATDVDSICYSKLSLDSIAYDDWQVQEIYTCDSVYRYSLAQIDSLSFKDVDINKVAEDIDRANGVIVPMFLQCESIGSLSQHLSTICNIEGVESAWTDNQTLFVKIRDYGTISFLYPPMPLSFDEDFSSSRTKTANSRSSEQVTDYTPYVNIGNAHTTINVHNACIYYQLENNEAAIWNNAKTLSIRLNDYFKDMGISSQRITNAGPDFFVNDIFDYDLIFLITHGKYDKEYNTHWLYTSFNPTWETIENMEKNRQYSPNKLSYGWVKEKRNGEWFSICYLTVSDKLIASSKNKFKNHKVIIYNAACESLKNNYNMGDVFINKGAICYLGYTDTNSAGVAGGYEFFTSLLNGSCIGQAYESITNSFKEEVFSEDGNIYHPVLKMVKANDGVYDVSKMCITHTETLPTEDIFSDNATTVRLAGRIKKLKSNFLADNYEYGFQFSNVFGHLANFDVGWQAPSYEFFYKEFKGVNNYDASSCYMNWEKTIDINTLDYNTTYYYRAYMYDGHSYCYGEIKSFTIKRPEAYAILDYHTGTLTLYYDCNKGSFELGPDTYSIFMISRNFSPNEGTFRPIEVYPFHEQDKIVNVVFDPSFVEYRPKTTRQWFQGCLNLRNIINMCYLNTTDVEDMWGMFYDCSSLMGVDLSCLDTHNVRNTGFMFYGCSSLTSLDLSYFDTSSVIDMDHVFCGCSSLKTIYAGNLHVNKGSYMFYGCENLVGGKGTKIGQNLYGYDEDGNPLYYYCGFGVEAAHMDGGKDNPGLFTAK